MVVSLRAVQGSDCPEPPCHIFHQIWKCTRKEITLPWLRLIFFLYPMSPFSSKASPSMMHHIPRRYWENSIWTYNFSPKAERCKQFCKGYYSRLAKSRFVASLRILEPFPKSFQHRFSKSPSLCKYETKVW